MTTFDNVSRVSTTHDPHGGGHPRLIFSRKSSTRHGSGHGVDDAAFEFALLPGVTTIGSHPDANLSLPGLDDWHAEVRRDVDDEYIYTHVGLTGRSTVDGARVGEKSLHTGDRIGLGDWSMSFFREEFADHGRPFGGRQGGEFSHQESQGLPRSRGTSAVGGSERDGSDPGEYF
ncbi:MAG: FHA domain-containing protein [Nocardioidaceae bacterium]